MAHELVGKSLNDGLHRNSRCKCSSVEAWQSDPFQPNTAAILYIYASINNYIYNIYIYMYIYIHMYFFPAVLCADQSGRTQCRALAQSRNQESLLKKIYSWQLHTHNYHRYVRQNYDIRELARRQTFSCDAASFASVFRLVFFHSQLLKQNVVRKRLVSWGRRCYF